MKYFGWTALKTSDRRGIEKSCAASRTTSGCRSVSSAMSIVLNTRFLSVMMLPFRLWIATTRTLGRPKGGEPEEFSSRSPQKTAGNEALDGPRHFAGEREQRLHHLVPAVCGRCEHQRASAVDHRDAVRASVLGCSIGDTSASERAVHPDQLDPEVCALPYRLLRDLRPRSDHNGSDAARYRLQIQIREVSLDGVRVGIDCEYVVPARAQPLVNDVASVTLGCS